VAGRAHRDGDGRAVDANLERLLDCHRVPFARRTRESDDVDLRGGIGRGLAHADSLPAVDAWLQSARDAIATAAGVPASELELGASDVRTLLDLARVAAHDSGERTNAPLLCYLIGLAAARSDAGLDAIADAVTSG
jgi:hypothetical protein